MLLKAWFVQAFPSVLLERWTTFELDPRGPQGDTVSDCTSLFEKSVWDMFVIPLILGGG